MTPAAVLTALLTYGPSILPLIQQVTGWIKENKQEVTAQDIAELIEYGRKSSADYLREATAAAQLPPPGGN